MMLRRQETTTSEMRSFIGGEESGEATDLASQLPSRLPQQSSLLAAHWSLAPPQLRYSCAMSRGSPAVFLLMSAALVWVPLATGADSPWFRIKVVDEATSRGVPLVELETVNRAGWITDSNGLIAFHEPGLMERPVFFHVRSYGYDFPKDGFGNAGVTLTPKAGGNEEVKITRRNIAERLYRITGQGIYRDSVLLGEPVPIRGPLLNAEVVGQDSAQVAVYGGKVLWLWGDTTRARYPLGHFWMSGATAKLPGRGGLAPSVGIDLDYFVDTDGFSRPMWPRPEEGLIWADGLVVVPDAAGRERLLAHASIVRDVRSIIGHRLSIFNDETSTFDNMRDYSMDEKWRCPSGHPVRHGEHYYFPASRESHAPFPAVRVRATVEDVKTLESYEAFTCLSSGAKFEGRGTRLERDATGALVYRWLRDTPPLTAHQERELIKARTLSAEEARFQPRDVESGKRPALHAGSVFWNDFRKKWILISVEKGGTSMLGEVWFGEADSLLGPWPAVRKIITHERYSFYNPVHHPFLDEEGGRIIYLEGTYSDTFSGAPAATPHYDYNQIMYRLDLADDRLRFPAPPRE